MATVSKRIADDIAAGLYEDDDARKIIKYQNAFGGESYGVVFGTDDPDMYAASEYVIDPVLYWERPQ